MLTVPVVSMDGFMFSVSAETSGDYVYTVSNGEAKITSVDTSISGEVTIPDTLDGYTVTDIDDYAFSSCSNITSIIIPASVTSIGEWAFFWCDNLTEINVDTNNSNYSSIDGVLFDKKATTLVKYPQGKTDISYTIPNDTMHIGEVAFYGCSVESLIISDSVTHIGDSAFLNCYKLTSITLPKNVVCIGEGVFEACFCLENINVVIENNSFCSINGVLFTKDCTKLICYPCGKNDTSYTVPNSVTNIEVLAFSDCSMLEKIVLGDNVVSIGECAFSYCESIETIYIPSSVVNIGLEAFFECSSLVEINVDVNNDTFCSIDGVLFDKECTRIILYPCGKSDLSYTIPTSVTTINDCAFECCSNLKTVNLPNKVTSIGEFAFYLCENLVSINIRGDVTDIGKCAFLLCNNLTVFCYEDSFVLQYCIDNQIPYDIIQKHTIMGDVNCDMVIDNKDLALLMQYINGWNVEVSIDATDVNADDKVNNKDYALVIRYINGWNIDLQGKIATKLKD